MESLIELLESNSIDWSIDFNRQNNTQELAQKYEANHLKYITPDDIKKIIIKKIKSTLQGSEISRWQLRKAEKHFSLKYHSSRKKHGRNQFTILSILRYAVNHNDTCTSNPESWALIKDQIEDYLSISTNEIIKSIEGMFSESKIAANSIIYLRKKGYDISVEGGEILIKEKSRIELLSAIRFRFARLGYQAVEIILQSMANLYDHKTQRHYLKSEPSITDSSKIDIPWGYLLNVSLANLYHKKPLPDRKRLIDESFTLAKHYFCLQQIQTHTKFSDINHDRETILPAIQRNILSDQHLSIDQISINHILDIMRGIFLPPAMPSNNPTLELYVDILDWVSTRSSHDRPLIFSKDEIASRLKLKYPISAIEEALTNLSFTAREINKDYFIPEQIEKRNYYKRPFVSEEGKYIYISPTISNYGFYFSATELCKSQGIDSGKLGTITEKFIERKLSSRGIKFIGNKKYQIPKDIAKELKIESKEGECDYIIETGSTIFLIELKRKTLTAESRKGSILQSTIDLAQSFLHALSQTGRHEYMLRRNGSIQFKDGTTIELSDREVERISLSLFDFYSLHDGSLIHQILLNLVGGTIKSQNPSDDKKINQYINEISNQYDTRVFKDIYGEERNPYFNCRFFSVPQLLEILSNCSNNESFKTEINRTRHVSTGCKDWFKDYSFIRSLHLHGKVKTATSA